MSSNVRPPPLSGQELLSKYRKAMEVKKKDGYDPNSWRGKNPALDKWHELVEIYKKDEASTGVHSEDMRSLAIAILGEILHDNVVFHPPTYWKARYSKMLVGIILGEVSSIFKDFMYHRQLQDTEGKNFMLEFSAMVDEIPVQGIDIIEFSSNSVAAQIIDFKVMVRPPEAALRLKEKMEAKFNEFMKQMGNEPKAKF